MNQEAFCDEFRSSYGYFSSSSNTWKDIDALRREEFPQLNKDVVHLDHGGATMYAKTQLEAVMNELTHCGPFSNPHSQGPLSARSRQLIDEARCLVLDFFHVTSEEYSVVFTAGATAALKCIGEAFPWSPSSTFAYAIDSHNSVVGIREYAIKNQANFVVVNLPDEEDDKKMLQNIKIVAQHKETRERSPPKPQQKQQQQRHPKEVEKNDNTFHLFAFPAECNFTGVRHNLKYVQLVQQHGIETTKVESPRNSKDKWVVVLDAAKYAATSPLDLSQFTPEFVVCSFYKMFGYPTGLGALLVHRSASHILNKTYFGGGAVLSSSATTNFYVPRKKVSEFLVDGTESFLAIAALKHGFRILNQIGMRNIREHTDAITQYLYRQLTKKKHFNGSKVVHIYGRHDRNQSSRQGPVLAMNFLRPLGDYVGHAEVEKMATLHGIQLRTGCFCNPGACQSYLELSNEDLLHHFAIGHVCWDDLDLIDGRPTGAVRVSLGYMSNYEDVATFLAFVDENFVHSKKPDVYTKENYLNHSTSTLIKTKTKTKEQVLEDSLGVSVLPQLVHLNVFPIKSCRAMSVKAWPLGPHGLLYDREWAIADSTGKILRLKDEARLAFFAPSIDLNRRRLTIAFHGRNSSVDVMSVALDASSFQCPTTTRSVNVCGQECTSRATETEGQVSKWISDKLGKTCFLVRCSAQSERKAHIVKQTTHRASMFPSHPTNSSHRDGIGFANAGQFLLLSLESVQKLNALMTEIISPEAFRANYLVSNCLPHDEDNWETITIGKHSFVVSGPCSRCIMVDMNPVTGAMNGGVLKKMASYRRSGSRIQFGQYLSYPPEVSKEAGATEELVGQSLTIMSKAMKWIRVGDPIQILSRKPHEP